MICINNYYACGRRLARAKEDAQFCVAREAQKTHTHTQTGLRYLHSTGNRTSQLTNSRWPNGFFNAIIASTIGKTLYMRARLGLVELRLCDASTGPIAELHISCASFTAHKSAMPHIVYMLPIPFACRLYTADNEARVRMLSTLTPQHFHSNTRARSHRVASIKL